MPPDVDIDEAEANGHSLFGASKAHRFLVCPGSLIAETKRPDISGFEAAEGTVAHEIAASFLSAGLLPRRNGYDKVVQNGFEITVTDAMLAYITEYCEWCRDEPGRHYVETRVDYSDLTPIPNQGGTADFFACRIGHCCLTDLKYGTGVQVFADHNPQLMLYAYGIWRAYDWIYDFDTFTLRICQPRLGHFDVWMCSRDDLLAFAAEARVGMAACWREDAVRVPGVSQCRFCRDTGCVARMAVIDHLIDVSFVDETITAEESNAALRRLERGQAPRLPSMLAASMETRHLARFLDFRKVYETAFANIAAELEQRVAAGEQVEWIGERWFMATGKNSRSVADVAEVTSVLAVLGVEEAALYERKFLSPAKLEELAVTVGGLRKSAVVKLLAPYITTTPGRPTLAQDKPGRDEAPDPADLFEDL